VPETAAAKVVPSTLRVIGKDFPVMAVREVTVSTAVPVTTAARAPLVTMLWVPQPTV